VEKEVGFGDRKDLILALIQYRFEACDLDWGRADQSNIQLISNIAKFL
jgi:hypothetical protein